MARRPWFGILLAVLAVVATAGEARADFNLTGFVGTTTTQAARGARGVAVGVGILIVGFEFEYANISKDEGELLPSLTTGMFNGMVQMPFPVRRIQIYGTIGGGVYHESLGTTANTDVALNYGGGVKITIAGPLRARIDYRLFNLRGSGDASTTQRLYGGLALSF